LSSSAHNVACAVLTKKYDIDGATLVRQTAPLQTLALLFIGPIMDKVLMGAFPWQWKHWNDPLGNCVQLIGGSCLLAALVNMSLVSCIKQYSATGAFAHGDCKAPERCSDTAVLGRHQRSGSRKDYPHPEHWLVATQGQS
jgi:hypothetical protein